MKLTHRGVTYTPSTEVIDTIETDTQLSFMGQTFKMRTQKVIPTKLLIGRLTYRGVSYRS